MTTEECGSSNESIFCLVESKDLEFEELAITEAIGLTLHGLDFVVDAFQRAGRNAVVVESQDAVAVFLQGTGELLEHGDLRRIGAANPSVQDSSSAGFVRLPPDLTQVLLEVVRDRQRRVELQGVLQALLFVAEGVEVFRVLEQQPKRALEALALAFVGQFAKQLAAKGA